MFIVSYEDALEETVVVRYERVSVPIVPAVKSLI